MFLPAKTTTRMLRLLIAVIVLAAAGRAYSLVYHARQLPAEDRQLAAAMQQLQYDLGRFDPDAAQLIYREGPLSGVEAGDDAGDLDDQLAIINLNETQPSIRYRALPSDDGRSFRLVRGDFDNATDPVDQGPANEQVVLENLIGFDVQVFAVDAPILLSLGDDRQPGTAGADDNGNGIIDHDPDDPQQKDWGELGATHSDDRLLTPNDPQFKHSVRGVDAARIASGCYVDQGWRQSVGGSLEWTADSPQSLRIVVRTQNPDTDEIHQREFIVADRSADRSARSNR